MLSVVTPAQPLCVSTAWMQSVGAKLNQDLRIYVILSDRRERRIPRIIVFKPTFWGILHFATLRSREAVTCVSPCMLY
jgi:hypothetical protein